MRLNEKANAIPLKAKEAIRGSPSPWKVLAMMPMQAAERVSRLHDSVPVNVEDIPIRVRRASWLIAILEVFAHLKKSRQIFTSASAPSALGAS